MFLLQKKLKTRKHFEIKFVILKYSSLSRGNIMSNNVPSKYTKNYLPNLFVLLTKI